MDKKLEKIICEVAEQEINRLQEASMFDKFKSLWKRGSGSNTDTSPDDPASASNADIDTLRRTKEVNIDLSGGTYSGTGEDALKDPEVLKLMALFNVEIPSADIKQVQRMVRLDPTRGIQFMLHQTGAKNKTGTVTPNQQDSSPTEVSIENELIPKLASISKRDKSKVQALKDLIGRKIIDLSAKDDMSKDQMAHILRKEKFSEEEVEELLSTMGNKKIVKEQLAITNLSETDVADLVNEINKFYPYAKEYLGFDRPVELTLISDPDNAKDTFGKTAYYSPRNEQMTIFVDGRHPKDIIRSFSHELVHHAQNCRGEFDRDFSVGENYIETDDHLKEMEREAYDKGNMCLRTYESYLKKENKTMNEETLRKSIREAIKRVVENKTHAVKETVVTEDSGEDEAWHQWKNEHADDDHIKEIEHHLHALRDDRDYEEHGAEYDHDKYEDEGMDETADKNTGLEDPTDKPEDTSYGHMKEDVVEEDEDYTAKKEKPGADKRKGAEKRGAEGTRAKTKGHGEVDYVNEEETTVPLHESMAIKKGQLVFDRLVNKWCK